VKRDVFGKRQKVHGIFQRAPAFSILESNAENLLDIAEFQGKRKACGQPVKADVPLQLKQFEGTPCTENEILAAPFKEPPENSGKRICFLKDAGVNMKDFLCFVMEALICNRPDIFMKTGNLRLFTIQFYGADLNDFKGKVGALVCLSVGALVPFEIKYYIIHEINYTRRHRDLQVLQFVQELRKLSSI